MARRVLLVFSLIIFLPAVSYGFDVKHKPKRIFSSRSVMSVADNLIIYGNMVVLQHKNDVKTEAEAINAARLEEQTRQVEIASAKKAGRQPPQFRPIVEGGGQIKTGRYDYKEPNDGCYMLENGFIFCCVKGIVTRVVREADKNALAYDYFFGENTSDVCKIAIFTVMYNLFYHKRIVKFHKYQLAMPPNTYPDLITVVVLAQEDMLEPSKLDLLIAANDPQSKLGINHQFDGQLIAFLFSSFHDIKCLPYRYIKAYMDNVVQLYDMHIPSYKLIGPWIKGVDFHKRIFLTVDGPYVRHYDIKSFSSLDLFRISQNDSSIPDPSKVLQTSSSGPVQQVITFSSDGTPFIQASPVVSNSRPVVPAKESKPVVNGPNTVPNIIDSVVGK